MKNIFIFSLLLAFTINAISQADTAVSGTSIKTDYLKKSKNQKTTAWVLLGGGAALMLTGALVSNNAVENDPFGYLSGTNDEVYTGAILFIVGGITSLTSIPFFIAGGKNKRRALSVSFKNKLVPQLKRNALVRLPIPSVSLIIEL